MNTRDQLQIPDDFIDDYRVNTPSEADRISNDEKVEKILGKAVKDEILHDGTIESISARKKFIDLLNIVLNDHDTDFTDFDEFATTPKNDAVKLEELLGKEGVALYKKAIEEEKQSKEFRNAVFLKSCTHYDGPKWAKQMILWVGGPSASGKSFGADAVVKKIDRKVMKKVSEENHDGNDVVSIDGGIEREVSQIRQLTLQVALKKGYPGISDLHKSTKLGIKGLIRKAALANKLNIVIPNTFTRPLAELKIAKYDQLDNVVQVFSEVTPAVDTADKFASTVARMGNERAWKTKYGVENARNLKISYNNLSIGIESKDYNKKFFRT